MVGAYYPATVAGIPPGRRAALGSPAGPGELTCVTCDEFAGVLAGTGGGAGPARAAVDTSGLEFFDSAGLRCLVSVCRKARNAIGDFVVIDTGRLRQRVQRMGLAGVLPVAAELPA
jgi:anti-anti-sigma factor